MTYDGKCYELAQHFLSDHNIADEDSRKRYTDKLAQMIQAAVADFLDDNGFRE